jgi:hypothetical protein
MLFRFFEKRRGEEGGKQTWHDAFEVFGADTPIRKVFFFVFGK